MSTQSSVSSALPDATPNPPSPSALNTTSTQLVASNTAAQAVYAIPELRSHIYRFLDQDDLAIFMRVEKLCAEEVPRELYRVMELDDLMRLLRVPCNRRTARQNLLCTLVQVVDLSCRWGGFPISHSDERLFGVLPDSDDPDLCYYHPRFFHFLVPTIRSNFPNARTFRVVRSKDYRPHGEENSWAVHHPAKHDPDTADTGIIEVTATVGTSLGANRPFDNVPEAPSGYVVRMRYDVLLQASSQAGEPRLLAAWREALLGSTPSRVLHHTARLDMLPVSLPEIVQMLQRQIDAGYTDLLEDIEAHQVAAWNITDFRTFATIASTSLHNLILCSGAIEPSSVVTFDDLPELVTIIRDHLPNLEILSLDMYDLEGAEEACGRALYEGCLNDTGRLKRLNIHIDGYLEHPHLLNTIRLLYRICDWDAQIRIDHEFVDDARGRGIDWEKVDEEGGLQYEQTNLLRYLYELEDEQREHLATIDLATIGVTTTAHFLALTFYTDGRPVPIWDTRSEDWEEAGRNAWDVLPALKDSLRDFTASGSDGQSWRGAKRAAEELIEEIGQKSVEAEIKEYVAVLERKARDRAAAARLEEEEAARLEEEEEDA